jgi:hypothetical protein
MHQPSTQGRKLRNKFTTGHHVIFFLFGKGELLSKCFLISLLRVYYMVNLSRERVYVWLTREDDLEGITCMFSS